MALTFEGMPAAAARADKSVMLVADAGEENGPYDPARFSLQRGGVTFRGGAMMVKGKVIKVTFAEQPMNGDVLTW